MNSMNSTLLIPFVECSYICTSQCLFRWDLLSVFFSASIFFKLEYNNQTHASTKRLFSCNIAMNGSILGLFLSFFHATVMIIYVPGVGNIFQTTIIMKTEYIYSNWSVKIVIDYVNTYNIFWCNQSTILQITVHQYIGTNNVTSYPDSIFTEREFNWYIYIM